MVPIWHCAASKSWISSSVAARTDGSFEAILEGKTCESAKIDQHPKQLLRIHPRKTSLPHALPVWDIEIHEPRTVKLVEGLRSTRTMLTDDFGRYDGSFAAHKFVVIISHDLALMDIGTLH